MASRELSSVDDQTDDAMDFDDIDRSELAEKILPCDERRTEVRENIRALIDGLSATESAILLLYVRSLEVQNDDLWRFLNQSKLQMLQNILQRIYLIKQDKPPEL